MLIALRRLGSPGCTLAPAGDLPSEAALKWAPWGADTLCMPQPLSRPQHSEPDPVMPAGGGFDGSRALVADAEVAPRIPAAAPVTSGHAFLDLLMLGALACGAPAAVLSVRQRDGTWSTLAYGLESKEGLNDPHLFDVLASRREPLEIADMVTAVPSSPLVQPPHSMRWAYGVALRNASGSLLGVVAVLDRWMRQLTRREQRAMSAVARQLTAHLMNLRRPPLPGLGKSEPQGSLLPHPGLSVQARPATDKRAEHQLLRSHEVAVMFDVTERTVINWAAAGKLPSLRTMGGHLRFRRDDVMRLLDVSGSEGTGRRAGSGGLNGHT